ncbi:MAG: diaminopimelate epimerase, partial [Candidatus Kapaibacterium sp.]
LNRCIQRSHSRSARGCPGDRCMTVSHMSGAGNRFLVIDDREDQLFADVMTPGQISDLFAKYARTDEAPFEGLLRVRSIDISHCSTDFYNPDGSRGMLCGNGARCAVRHAVDHGASPNGTLSCMFNGTTYTARFYDDSTVGIILPTPAQVRYFPIGTLENVTIPVWYVDVHSDHVVIEAPHDAGNPYIGMLRHHADFPRGVNVNMAEMISDDTIRLATFERGVEAITQACGTGAVSTAVTMWMHDPSITRFTIVPPSGRELVVTIFANAGHIDSIELRGDAVYDHP